MNRTDICRVLLKIITNKYNNLRKNRTKGLFEKILDFEGNAVGQVGEEFVKEIFEKFKINVNTGVNETIHDEYDILLTNGKKVEIKTARKGRESNTYQFNGLNPFYNYDYIILIGISSTDVKYLLIKGKVKYNHKDRKHYLEINNKNKNLTKMNPNDDKNLKFTLKDNDLKDISLFEKEVKQELLT